MEYRREIDGLRAIAVLPVILFHAGFEGFSGGYVGVDIFFVISGYLITTIILSEKEKGTFSLTNFYERRARRILPALFVVMAVCFPFAWLFLLPRDFSDFSQSLVAVPLFSSNILFWMETGYFDTAAEYKPLLHTWSLAVEEQYYVLFPLLLMFMWRYRKRWIFGSIIVIGVFSLMLAQWGAFNKPSATFFLLPMRAWELMVGASVAFYSLYGTSYTAFVDAQKRYSNILSSLGLLLICLSIVFFDESTPFPSFYTLIPVLGVALIIYCSSYATLIGRILGCKFLVGIGLLSYSLYLWHQPILAFVKYAMFDYTFGEGVIALALLTIFILSYLSWKYEEKPFRSRTRFSTKQIFSFSAVLSLLFISVGVYGHLNDGFKNRDIGLNTKKNNCTLL